MGVNGVSHHIVEDDLAGVETMLKWLSFVPATLPGAPSTLRSSDPITRPIEYTPDKGRSIGVPIIPSTCAEVLGHFWLGCVRSSVLLLCGLAAVFLHCLTVQSRSKLTTVGACYTVCVKGQLSKDWANGSLVLVYAMQALFVVTS